MNAVQKRNLSIEAQMQLNALKKLNLWKNIAIAVSTLGVAAVYAGIAGNSRSLFLSVPGVIIIVFGVSAALVLNLGIRNGRKNVEKMLAVLDAKGDLS